MLQPYSVPRPTPRNPPKPATASDGKNDPQSRLNPGRSLANNSQWGAEASRACGCQIESLFVGKGLHIMLKKLGIVAVIVVASFVALRMTKLGSYAGTAWSKIRAGANNSVPVEFEIDRLRHELAQLG